MEKITLCGDNCLECPRYLADTDEKRKRAAELWHRVDGENVLFQIARFPVPAVLPTNSVLTSWWNVRKNMGWKNAISAVSFLAPK